MELVSVIIAVFNCERYIVESLQSILNQTYPRLEILICDDCSTDRTWEILSSQDDPRIRLYRNDTNMGVVETRNFLLSKANGKYFLIQDGDDWSDRTRIEMLIKTFDDKPDIDACVTAHYRVDNHGAILRTSNLDSFYVRPEDCLSLPFMPATLMLRSRVYFDLGGYDPYFSRLYGEDWYWIIRILQEHKLYYLNQPLYYYRFNGMSITNTAVSKEKFIVSDLMAVFVKQRNQFGTDWLQQQDFRAIAQFKEQKFKDRKWLSEKYRIAAAVQRDGKKRWAAFQLILNAIGKNPLSVRNYITLRYILL